MDIKIVCSNLASTRRSVVRLANLINQGQIDDLPRARLLLDALRLAVTCHEKEQGLRVAEEVQAIKTRLKDRGVL